MASIVYDSFIDDTQRGNVVPSVDTFKGMLLLAAYTPNKGTHTRRSDLTNETSGTGYTAGGNAVTLVVTKDTVNHRVDISITVTSWPSSSITGRYLAIYKSRGGLATADELVCLLDFGADVTSTSGTFSVTVSSPLRYQN